MLATDACLALQDLGLVCRTVRDTQDGRRPHSRTYNLVVSYNGVDRYTLPMFGKEVSPKEIQRILARVAIDEEGMS